MISRVQHSAHGAAGCGLLFSMVAPGFDGAGLRPPSFGRGTTSYTASVANDVASLTLSPELTNTLATYEIGSNTDSEVIGDTVDLTVGENVITVTVLLADTTETKTYTVTVTRASP